MSGIFEADAEGFREMNAGRPAAHLVREAVQNVFDEAATLLDVKLSWEQGQGVRFTIEDDVPGGIRDERLIWTIWLSDKVDSPTKRGRMGRGLKELISVSDETLIVTAGGPAVSFVRSRGKWTRSSPRKVRPATGTRVEGHVKLWTKGDMLTIERYLHHMRPPAGITFRVNGVEVTRATAAESYRLKLPTVLFEAQEGGDRVAREPRKETTVDLFSEPEAWVYEMGIPVELIDFPLSIDVGQRVPLREKRDTLTEPYRRLSAGLVPVESMKDNHVMVATRAADHLSDAAKQAIAHAWTDGRAYAGNPEVARAATGMHVPVVALRALPESIRDIVRETGRDARQVINEMRIAACSTIGTEEYTSGQKEFVDTWEWIATGIRRPCKVRLATGKPSAAASFDRDSHTLTVYIERVGATAVSFPLSASALSLLIHELAHWAPHDDEHGFDFHSDAEHVGGAVAAFLYNNRKVQ